MKPFKIFLHENEDGADILTILDSFDDKVKYSLFDEYIGVDVFDKETLKELVSNFPEDIDYEIYTADDSDMETSINISDIDSVDTDMFTVIVYTYNLDFGDVEYEDDEQTLTEVKRIIKVNAKGKKRIKMQCKKGFKWDGSKCQRISGKELVNKKRAIKKAVKTKKSMGVAFKRKRARAWKKAMRKRKALVGNKR